MSAAARGRSAWLVPLLLFLAVLLAAGLAFNVANLDTGGEVIPAPPNAGGTPASPDLFDFGAVSPYLAVVFGGLMIVAFVYAWRRRSPVRREVPYQPASLWQYLQTLLAMALFFAILVLWPGATRHAGTNETADAGSTAGNGTMSILPGVAGIPLGLFLAASLLVALLILFYVLHLGEVLRNLRPRAATEVPERAVAVGAVQATIEELELGGDVRTAILACYQRFCRLLGQRGIREQEPLTPRELQDLAVRRLGVGADRAESLTSLFEEARYSVHPLGDPDRDRALANLEALRTDLGG